MTKQAESPSAKAGVSYSYRPSLLAPGWTFRLTEEGVAWSAGNKSDLMRYGNIRRIRMRFRPMSMQWQRFTTDVWSEDGQKLHLVSTSWKSLVEQERLDQSYTAFVAELHRRVAAAGAFVRCEKGANKYLYWPGLLAFVAMSLGFAALIARAVQAKAIGGLVFIAAFLLLFLWQGGNFFRRNRPGLYAPDAPPPELMP